MLRNHSETATPVRYTALIRKVAERLTDLRAKCTARALPPVLAIPVSLVA